MMQESRHSVTAILGPTNTGKTFLAIERMLGYRSGVIGFPLRLLARENYDKAVRIKGRHAVALVTGEEKIIPQGARYFFCTVESMPLDRPFEFLAIDEVQMAADPERGHIFTDRILHAQGEEETMLLGADTIRPVLQQLVRRLEVISRPRFSTLSYAGPRKLTRLPPRSAVVGFSAAEVYATAELIRRQRGGTAVILGALSPRTRNAQVALFDSGEVDYLVATDAIGMGLNLSLDHVAFSRLTKFDGRLPRRLTPAEVGQIAGRAGRHMNDGSFGPTAELGSMDPELVEAVESHRFDPLRFVFWRNRKLEFKTPQALLRSLEAPSQRPELVKAREAGDHLALASLVRDQEVLALANHPAAVALLWEVCQVPDFRKVMSDQHSNLLRRLFLYLRSPQGQLPEDWVAGQIKRIDRYDGDIDALVARIAHVRTWTYITHRGDWLAESGYWQARSRAIEDKLSDTLHERLTQRFVDRRTAVLLRRLKDSEPLIGAIRKNGEVLVEGEFVGRLEGFRFQPDEEVSGEDAKALLTAARRALSRSIPNRVKDLEATDDQHFTLEPAGRITWQGEPVARIVAGSGALSPRVEPLASDLLDGAQRERVRRRLADWLARRLRSRLPHLFQPKTEDLTPAARGLVFQVIEALGCLERPAITTQISSLTKAERRALQDLGLRLGVATVFFPSLLRPRALRLKALLWAVAQGQMLPDLPAKGAAIYRVGESEAGRLTQADQESLCRALGFRVFRQGGLLFGLRADVLERVVQDGRSLSRRNKEDGGFDATPLLSHAPGLEASELTVVLQVFGFRRVKAESGLAFLPRNPKRRGKGKAKAQSTRSGKRSALGHQESPFAKLRDLKLKR